VEMVDRPDPAMACVLVLDESAFERLPVPLVNPEKVVLISQQDPQLLARAWDASIVSVISRDDSLPTVLMAIMAAALRIGRSQARSGSSVNSPGLAEASASITQNVRVPDP
jgi:hypothetical protein